MSRKNKSRKLLDSSESEPDEPGFQLNNDYAKRYEKWRGNEEMQKLKDRYGENLDEAMESSDSESTSEEEWTTEHETGFLTALSSLKGKDPKIYDSSKMFFTSTSSETKADEASKKTKKEKDKPFLMKDHERKMILENRVDGDSEDEVDKPRPPSYYEQQDQIKKDLKAALAGFDTEDGNADLLKKRIKTEVEIEQEEEDYRKWLKGELKKLDGNVKEEELKFLRDYWNDPKLDDGEQFLRDYVLQRKYLEEEENKEYIPTYDEIIHDSDEGGLSGDEKQVEEMEKFETKFNFRFEEPDQEFIKKYPRTIAESYRRKETKRKEERVKAKERRQEEKDRKVAEIQQLKALKRKEILEKIDKLQKVTGEEDLPFGDIDLEGDFDPDEHDRKMNAIFNQEYYTTEMDDTKPIFPFDEEIDGDQEDIEAWVPSDEEDGDDEDEGPSEESVSSKRKKKKNRETDNGDIAEIPITSTKKQKSVSATTVKSELLEISKGKRMGRKKSMYLEALEKEKPKFDPSIHKSFEKYFDEYYKLDFEDLVGDLPCRFKYRNVVPNDFGLTTDEVLKANDAELNQWASLKKTYQYRTLDEEKYEVQAYSKKANDSKKKKQLLASIYSQKDNDDGDHDFSDNELIDDSLVKTKTVDETQQSEQKKKKKKKKKKKSSVLAGPAESITAEVTQKSNDEKKESITAEKEVVPKRKKSKPAVPAVPEPTQTADSSKSADGTVNQPLSKRKRKNRKRSQNSTALTQDNMNSNTNGVQSSPDPVPAPSQSKNLQQANKKKVKSDKALKRKATPAPAGGISEDRLRAYGINPTKYEKRRKYGK